MSERPRQITETDELAALCAGWRNEPYIAIDTEFMRESTFWPILCLVQISGADDAVVIDPLAKNIDLEPLFDLLCDAPVIKVFHAARQDMEVLLHLSGRMPKPIFDTQIAAMVCGFGDSVGYDTLVAKLTGARIDKSLRFTDWSRRPLSDKQLLYALSDVTHLRPAYEKLARRLNKTDRTSWLEEEMTVLTSPETYQTDPQEAWRRIKARSGNARFLSVLRAIAAWRETEARARDVPRNRVLRDQALSEIAAQAPTNAAELARLRTMNTRVAESATGRAILDAVRHGLAVPEAERPSPPPRKQLPSGIGPLVDLLKVLLKMRCEEAGVAHRMVASADELERIASEPEADVPAMRGWRRKIFGDDALALKEGRIALAAKGNRVKVVKLDSEREINPPDRDGETRLAST
jgi:ribonuclease D